MGEAEKEEGGKGAEAVGKRSGDCCLLLVVVAGLDLPSALRGKRREVDVSPPKAFPNAVSCNVCKNPGSHSSCTSQAPTPSPSTTSTPQMLQRPSRWPPTCMVTGRGWRNEGRDGAESNVGSVWSGIFGSEAKRMLERASCRDWTSWSER